MSKKLAGLTDPMEVAGTPWRVQEGTFDPEDADTVGYTDVREQTVTIYTGALREFPKQGPARKVKLHEAVHICLIEAGLDELLGDKLDEAVCKAVEKGLWPLIQQGHFTERGQ